MVLFSAGMMQWFCVVTSSGSSLSREDKIAHQVLLILVLEGQVLYRHVIGFVSLYVITCAGNHSKYEAYLILLPSCLCDQMKL